jgi:hypothetical protein
MSYSNNQAASGVSNVHAKPIEYAGDVRADLLALRMSVTVAWQERAVMLTREEQRELQAEIKELCHFLQHLTGLRDGG